MAAIIRMKRKKDENQLNEVVVHLKRERDKTGDNEEDTFSKKFKYAATVNSKDSSVVDPVQNAIREIKLNRFNNFENNVFPKRQESSQRSTKLIDYKIITKKRASQFKSLGNDNETSSEGEYFFFDLEENSKKESEAGDSSRMEDDYVYDLYYINDQTFNYQYLDNICTFQAMQQPDNLYNEDDQDDDNYAYDDEDENAENYYTNQYPDPEDLVLLNINDDDEDDEEKSEDDDDDEDDEEYNGDDYDAEYYKPV